MTMSDPTDKASVALLPCPFCGCADIMTDSYIRDGREVICRSCGAATHAFMPDANSKAIAKWNSRALSPAQGDGIFKIPHDEVIEAGFRVLLERGSVNPATALHADHISFEDFRAALIASLRASQRQ